MKKANKEQNIYSKVAFAYLSALRTVKLAEGYENLSDIMSDYDEITEKCELERNEQLLKDKKIAEERRLDMERKKAQKKHRNAGARHPQIQTLAEQSAPQMLPKFTAPSVAADTGGQVHEHPRRNTNEQGQRGNRYRKPRRCGEGKGRGKKARRHGEGVA